jgi:hypothetical protein
LDRRKIRSRFEARFSATRMAKEYESQYRKMVMTGGASERVRFDIRPSGT